MRRQGYLNPTQITQKWKEHRARTNNWSSLLWTVLMFQAWVAEEAVTARVRDIDMASM
jgi:asparagine synthase (glutamine-hydrolysing)